MPRRSIKPYDSKNRPIIDMKTGQPAADPAIPKICAQIAHYRAQSGMDQKELAEEIGVTANAVSNWESGRSRPDLNLVPNLARVLHVSLYELFGVPSPKDWLSYEERMILDRYSGLSPAHRYAVRSMIDALSEAELALEVPPLRKYTAFGRSLSAGFGDPSEFDDAGEPFYVYDSPDLPQADCVFSVSGDSMEPRFRDGDRVLISRIPDAPELRPGEIGAFIVGNETYIKVYQKDGLHSLNPAYQPLRFDETERVYLIGRVTGVLDPKDVAGAADVSRFLLLHPEEK